MSEKQVFTVEKASVDDLDAVIALARAMGGAVDVGYYQYSFGLNDAGERDVYLARLGGEGVGFVMLNWKPKYKYFAQENMPEIQDLNVLEAYRGRGFGRALVAHCEGIARAAGHGQIGIGVGLTASYGAAQRLYVQMGYVPDGFGVTYDRQGVRHGERVAVDDDLSLMLVKGL